MNTKKVASLYAQIKKADSILSSEYTETIRATFAHINGKCYNEVISFGWMDESGQKYRVVITEEGLHDSFINDSGEICLIDDEGDEFCIRLYENKIIVPMQNW
jgi:hypothetical protein